MIHNFETALAHLVGMYPFQGRVSIHTQVSNRCAKCYESKTNIHQLSYQLV